MSLFTGAGGLDWGFHRVGLGVSSAIDLREDSARTYARNFGLEVCLGETLAPGCYSVADISLSRPSPLLSSPLVLLGGPPCQDFSVLRGPGERLGGLTPRGSLYLHYARYLALLQPLFFVFENVPGMLSANGGRDARAALRAFSHLEGLAQEWREEARLSSTAPPAPQDLVEAARRGLLSYRVVFWGVVDASWHGVPQRRKRFLVVGAREDLPLRPEHVAAVREAVEGSPALRKYPLTAMEALEGEPLTELGSVYREVFAGYGSLYRGGSPVDDYLEAHGGHPRDPLFERAILEHASVLDLLGWRGRPLSALLSSFPDRSHELPKESPRVLERMGMVPPGGNYEAVRGTAHGLRGRGPSLLYRRLHPLLPAYTVVAHGGGGTWGYHYRRERSRLTNRERARLQSFPDTFLFHGTASGVRSQIGEAVPPLLSLSLAEWVRGVLSDLGPLPAPRRPGP